MFTVPARPEDPRRRRAALTLALGLNASLLAALFAIPTAVAPPKAEAAALTYVEIVSPPAPRAASSPARRPTAASRAPAASLAVVAPVPPAAPPALTPPASPQPDAALTPGAPEAGPSGPGSGEGGGPGSGPGPGDGSGTGEGTGDGALRDVPWTQVKVRRQVVPDYPAEAVAAGLGEAVCTVRLAIDTEGRPTDAQVSGCPSLLAQPAQQAAMRWRFAPLLEGRTPVPGRFTIRFRFRPDAG